MRYCKWIPHRAFGFSHQPLSLSLSKMVASMSDTKMNVMTYIAIAVIISKSDNYHFVWLCASPLVMERLLIKPKNTLGVSDRKTGYPWKSNSEKIWEPVNLTQIRSNMSSQKLELGHLGRKNTPSPIIAPTFLPSCSEKVSELPFQTSQTISYCGNQGLFPGWQMPQTVDCWG